MGISNPIHLRYCSGDSFSNRMFSSLITCKVSQWTNNRHNNYVNIVVSCKTILIRNMLRRWRHSTLGFINSQPTLLDSRPLQGIVGIKPATALPITYYHLSFFTKLLYILVGLVFNRINIIRYAKYTDDRIKIFIGILTLTVVMFMMNCLNTWWFLNLSRYSYLS